MLYKDKGSIGDQNAFRTITLKFILFKSDVLNQIDK
jgi:hypothetical protein